MCKSSCHLTEARAPDGTRLGSASPRRWQVRYPECREALRLARYLQPGHQVVVKGLRDTATESTMRGKGVIMALTVEPTETAGLEWSAQPQETVARIIPDLSVGPGAIVVGSEMLAHMYGIDTDDIELQGLMRYVAEMGYRNGHPAFTVALAIPQAAAGIFLLQARDEADIPYVGPCALAPPTMVHVINQAENNEGILLPLQAPTFNYTGDVVRMTATQLEGQPGRRERKRRSTTKLPRHLKKRFRRRDTVCAMVKGARTLEIKAKLPWEIIERLADSTLIPRFRRLYRSTPYGPLIGLSIEYLSSISFVVFFNPLDQTDQELLNAVLAASDIELDLFDELLVYQFTKQVLLNPVERSRFERAFTELVRLHKRQELIKEDFDRVLEIAKTYYSGSVFADFVRIW